ncbi:MAG: hypothetical protein KC586_04310 [Myxococcales bacterium]|nr:hypothetical protein [Myxococcales bacterium]
MAPADLFGRLQQVFQSEPEPLLVPGTRLTVPTRIASSALELARAWRLSAGDVWLLAAATRTPRVRDLASHFGLGVRTIEGRSAEIRAKSGHAVRDLVHSVFWMALGEEASANG